MPEQLNNFAFVLSDEAELRAVRKSELHAFWREVDDEWHEKTYASIPDTEVADYLAEVGYLVLLPHEIRWSIGDGEF